MDRFEGVVRPYSPEDVSRLRDRFGVQHVIAKRASEKLWKRMITDEEP